MIFENFDSSIFIPEELQLYCISNAWTYPYTHNIPIYLVSPETIDKITPPERQKGINPECLGRIKRIIEEVIRDLDEFERLFKEIEGVIERCSINIKAEGVFIPKDVDLPVETPAIFVCPERIYESAKDIAKKLNISPDKTFASLLRAAVIHEQNHAFTWKRSNGLSYDKYKHSYVRILEEFSAQFTAYTHLDSLGKIIFTEKSKNQPLEYNTWKAFPGNEILSLDVATHLADLYKGLKPLPLELCLEFYPCWPFCRIYIRRHPLLWLLYRSSSTDLTLKVLATILLHRL